MRAEWQAFKSRIESHPILVSSVYPVVRRDKHGLVKDNYLVARSSAPDRVTDNRYTAVQRYESDRRFTYDVRVVTVDADGLDTWGEAVLSHLVGHELVVAGRKCDPISLVENVEEGDGFDTNAELFYRDFSFRFWSRRA